MPLQHAPEWAGVLRYNAFSHVTELEKPSPWDKAKDWQPRPWSDTDDIKLAVWLQRHKVGVGTSIAAEAVQVASYDRQYHPVRDYLNSLKWDGKPRLPTWLAYYLGAEQNAYHEAVGPRWMISGVARILAPGPNCKADCVLILEGEQGLLKSTALRVLAGIWFLDDLRKFGGREAAMQLVGRWVVELAELSAMNEATVDSCKAFLSQNMDSIRAPYGRRVIDVARQCIFAASTNRNAFLKDETGERRYWPVSCTKIDIEALQRDRDQLWAEATHRYKNGEKWWLETSELRQIAEEEQEARFDNDPWEREVKHWIQTKKITISEHILNELFDVETRDVTRGQRNRISKILTHLSWKRIRLRAGKNRGEYVWIAPKTEPEPAEIEAFLNSL